MTVSKRLDVQELDDVLVLHLRDPRLADAIMVEELESQLLAIVSTYAPTKVVVNFAGVGFCSTSVINGLLRTKKRLKATGGELRLCGMKDVIREAYRILNLDGTVFTICDDVASAIRSFAVSSPS